MDKKYNIKKIIIIGDLLRNYAPPRSATPADGFIKHVYFMFSEQIQQVTGLPVYYETTTTPKFFDRNKFYRLCQKKLNTDNWVSMYTDETESEAVKYVKTCFSDSLLIFQEAGALRKYVDEANIPYIDMFISSIRFTEDLNYAMRSNIESIRNNINLYRIPEISFKCQANLIKAFYNLRKKIKLCENSCLLCGQTSVDLSVIKDGKLMNLLDFTNEIQELKKKYSVIYYKIHPNADPNSAVEKQILSIPYIIPINCNIYQLLSTDEIVAVAALSSSVLQEAVYFNKKTHILLHPYVNYYKGNGEITKDTYINVSHECFSTDFWTKCLNNIINTKQCEYFNFYNDSQFLRKVTKGYQGYNADELLELLKEKNKISSNLKQKFENLNFCLFNLEHKYNSIILRTNIFINNILFKIFHKNCFMRNYVNAINKLTKIIKGKNTKNKFSNITVVLQGSIKSKFYGLSCVEISVASIRKLMPSCKIILSTWEGEKVPKNLLVDKIIYNNDPSYYTRDCTETGKKNNVNRQIVSTIEGINEVETSLVLKLRTDFILTNLNFIKEFNKYRKFDKKYRIFERRILCSMFDTRMPYGQYYNLPFHVGDLFYFGLKDDLKNLFEIPLVTNKEFTWFADHTNIVPDTFAKNKYNAEQSIWINCLKKNNRKVKCEYSTHINEEIAVESDKYLVNNFEPFSFKKFGALPLKNGLRAENRILTYCDNYTFIEWQNLYKKYCYPEQKIKSIDIERKIINFAIKIDNFKKNNFIKSSFKKIQFILSKIFFD